MNSDHLCSKNINLNILTVVNTNLKYKYLIEYNLPTTNGEQGIKSNCIKDNIVMKQFSFPSFNIKIILAYIILT